MAPQFCRTCKQDVEAEEDEAEGHSFCPICGLQLEDMVFESGVSFIKSGDTAHVAGSLIREDMLGRAGGAGGGGYGYGDDSRGRSIEKGRQQIQMFADQLRVPRPGEYSQQATRLYQLAVSSGFTRGRRTNQVAAACLYIVLRQDNQPFMLIDFCNLLRVNVYVLGATFLRLAEKIRFDKHPVFCRPVDPSLFIHRFAGKLKLGSKTTQVIETAMQLVAQMKRDWLQTGRRPAGVCGAALWLSAHIHGFELSRKDVIKVVSVGETTIQHRISELRSTMASDMTLSEFHEHSKKLYQETNRLLEAGPQPVVPPAPAGAEVGSAEAALALEGGAAAPDPPGASASGAVCREVFRKEAPLFALGMCRECYTAYLNSSGGIWRETQDPPAYLRNLRKQVKAHRAEEKRKRVRFLEGDDDDSCSENGALASVQGEFALAIMDDPSMLQLAQALPTRDDLPASSEVAAGRDHAEWIASTHARFNAVSEADLDQPGPSTSAAAAQPVLALPPPLPPLALLPGPSSAPPRKRAACEPPASVDLALFRIDDCVALTEDDRRRARELSEANATPVVDEPEAEDDNTEADPEEAQPDDASQQAGPSTSRAKPADGDGDEDEDEEGEDADGNPSAAALTAPTGASRDGTVETLSDVDDDEIAECLATKEEIDIKTKIWQDLNMEWEHAQAAKAASQAAAAEAAKLGGVAVAPGATKKKRGRASTRAKPKAAAFTVGETAMESVQRMLAAKNLTSKVNLSALQNFFGETDAIAKGAVSIRDLQEKEAPKQQPPPREDPQQLPASQRSQQHMEALLREGSGGAGGLLAGIGPGDVRASGPRLGRLVRLS